MLLPIPERYTKISGFDEYYITESGRVFAYRTRKVGYQGLRELSLKGINDPARYLQVCLSDQNGKHYRQVHDLVARHFCDGYFPGAVVNHKDCNIHNNHYSNLEWITQRENIHKSYVDSGLGPVRNYRMFELTAPDGTSCGMFVGRNEALRFVKSHCLDTSCSSLARHGVSRGYTLLPIV